LTKTINIKKGRVEVDRKMYQCRCNQTLKAFSK